MGWKLGILTGSGDADGRAKALNCSSLLAGGCGQKITAKKITAGRITAKGIATNRITAKRIAAKGITTKRIAAKRIAGKRDSNKGNSSEVYIFYENVVYCIRENKSEKSNVIMAVSNAGGTKMNGTQMDRTQTSSNGKQPEKKENIAKKKQPKKNKFGKWVRSLIPHYATNRQVLGFLYLSTWIKFPPKIIRTHHGKNMEKLLAASQAKAGEPGAFYQPHTYIENQSEWKDIEFGITDMAYAGCEIMATYNARLSLGEEMAAQEMAELIQSFERRGAVLGGIFGTAPVAIYKYFRSNGYRAEMATGTSEEEVNELGERCGTVIITFFNNRDDIMAQVHTVNVSREQGGYACHNARLAGEGGNICGSLAEVVRRVSNGKAKLICVIGIDPKQGTEDTAV
ncbi:MAG: hypothetical protein K1W26_02710 [Acetatifactor sp.]